MESSKAGRVISIKNSRSIRTMATGLTLELTPWDQL